MKAVYKNRCPNCRGDISSERLELGLFCEKCMDINQNKCEVDLINYKKFYEAEEKLNKFNKFFKEKIGDELSSIQKMWAKRFFLDNSFALLTPTGIGKTTFGLLLAAFVQKSYIVFPTKLLVLQALEKFKSWEIDVLAYTGKKEEKDKIKSGEYDILITTTQFLYKNYEIINKDFDLIFIDDVDSILKSAKKIDIVLKLLGIDEKTINLTLELIEKKDYVKLRELKVEKKGHLIAVSYTHLTLPTIA
jgi:reverse gyrase